MAGAEAPFAAATPADADTAALAKGGRQNFVGFLLRLAARIPFLFIAGRLYGAESLGRFASALVVVELCAMLASLGEKRGLAQRLSEGEEGDAANLVWEMMLLALLFSTAAAALLWLIPAPLFPSGDYDDLDKLIVISIPAFALTEIVLAAQAAAIAEIKPGKRFTDGHDAAVKVLAQGMLDTGLLDRAKDARGQGNVGAELAVPIDQVLAAC